MVKLYVCLVAISLTASLVKAQGLKGAATKHNKYIGTAVANNHLGESQYATILDKDFNMVTCENEMKFDATEGSRGSFNYGNADKIVSHATGAGQKIRGHTFIWHSQLPSWVGNGNFNASEMQKILENHINNVAGHYKGKIYAWDVVNEIFEDNGQFRQSPWYKALGKDFVAMAFKAARAADPAAKLYINDYNVEGVNSKSTAMYNLVKELKAANVPIDGAGFQSHFIVGSLPGDFQTNLERFAALGVDVAITELDIRTNTPASSDKLTQQGKDYATVAKACLAISRCVGITIWGFTDKYSWVPNTFSGQGAALLYDDNYKEKAAYTSLLQALG